MIRKAFISGSLLLATLFVFSSAYAQSPDVEDVGKAFFKDLKKGHINKLEEFLLNDDNLETILIPVLMREVGNQKTISEMRHQIEERLPKFRTKFTTSMREVIDGVSTENLRLLSTSVYNIKDGFGGEQGTIVIRVSNDMGIQSIVVEEAMLAPEGILLNPRWTVYSMDVEKACYCMENVRPIMESENEERINEFMSECSFMENLDQDELEEIDLICGTGLYEDKEDTQLPKSDSVQEEVLPEDICECANIQATVEEKMSEALKMMDPVARVSEVGEVMNEFSVKISVCSNKYLSFESHYGSEALRDQIEECLQLD